MKIISIRENIAYKEQAIKYIQDKWASNASMKVYEDCINHSVDTDTSLPYWYLLLDDKTIIGCAGMITNDFISRMDLMPWFCSLYIEENYRGNGYGHLLLERAKKDAINEGFSMLYLCTDHVGYYEKNGFQYIGQGFHPWGESSRIYGCRLK